MSKTTKVSVPKELGDQVTISVGGSEPTTYKITDGHVTVPNEEVDTFLSVVSGSEVQENDTTNKGDS